MGEGNLVVTYLMMLLAMGSSFARTVYAEGCGDIHYCVLQSEIYKDLI